MDSEIGQYLIFYSSLPRGTDIWFHALLQPQKVVQFDSIIRFLKDAVNMLSRSYPVKSSAQKTFDLSEIRASTRSLVAEDSRFIFSMMRRRSGR